MLVFSAKYILWTDGHIHFMKLFIFILISGSEMLLPSTSKAILICFCNLEVCTVILLLGASKFVAKSLIGGSGGVCHPLMAIFAPGRAVRSAILLKMIHENPALTSPESWGSRRIRCMPTESCLPLRRTAGLCIRITKFALRYSIKTVGNIGVY